ncbi:hypothetical protein HPB48_014651 [Haemaphysalis longicornis]|uniref:Endonuclease/exonuclease/phosphatase domain-containing protein n=1 Tax=Haemaphysalis longicornis TaxID=44386 RepID=A0A9J6GKK3_HAELO|nr:hypothetical protein HPB48_014651 [Haemaphysalis longicornis]
MTDDVYVTAYRAVFGESTARGTRVILDSKLTQVVHDLKIPFSCLEYAMIEVTPNQKNKASVFIPNEYIAPRGTSPGFKLLLQKASKLAGNHPMIVAGDFNSHYDVWGFKHHTDKASDLWENAAKIDRTLVA